MRTPEGTPGDESARAIHAPVVLPFVFMCTSLHQALRGQASDQYHDRFVKYGTTATSADWDFLRRASARSHWRTGRWIWVSEDPDSDPAAASSTHRLEQSQGSPVFFLDTAALAVLLPFQTRTLVVPIQTGTWQACVGERFQAIQCDQALLAKILGESSFTLNGRTLPADYDLGALTDTTLRLRLIGLPGGMPGSSGDSEFAGLAKKALMKRATELGVPTRTGQGNARTWRPMADVRRDCEQNIAGLSSSSQALPGASSSFQSLPAAPHISANHEDVSIADEAQIIKTEKKRKRNDAKWDAKRKTTAKRKDTENEGNLNVKLIPKERAQKNGCNHKRRLMPNERARRNGRGQ